MLFLEWNPKLATMDNQFILGVLLTPAFEISYQHVKTHCFFRL